MPENTPNTKQDYTRSNAEIAAKWKIDVNRDPYDIPLGELDPAHDDLFAANKTCRGSSPCDARGTTWP